MLVGTADLLLDAGQHNLTAHAPVGTMADERCQQKRAVTTNSIEKLKSKPLRGTRNPGLSWDTWGAALTDSHQQKPWSWIRKLSDTYNVGGTGGVGEMAQ